MDMINKLKLQSLNFANRRKFLLKSFIKRYFNLWKKKVDRTLCLFGNELGREQPFPREYL